MLCCWLRFRYIKFRERERGFLDNNFSLKNNTLIDCLKINHLSETSIFQGKMADSQKISSGLSTGFVDLLSIAKGTLILQPT